MLINADEFMDTIPKRITVLVALDLIHVQLCRHVQPTRLLCCFLQEIASRRNVYFILDFVINVPKYSDYRSCYLSTREHLLRYMENSMFGAPTSSPRLVSSVGYLLISVVLDKVGCNRDFLGDKKRHHFKVHLELFKGCVVFIRDLFIRRGVVQLLQVNNSLCLAIRVQCLLTRHGNRMLFVISGRRLSSSVWRLWSTLVSVPVSKAFTSVPASADQNNVVESSIVVGFHFPALAQYERRMITYDGLGACIINNQSYEEEDSGTSRGNGCLTDSLDDDAFSSCSSSKDASSSFSSKLLPMKYDDKAVMFAYSIFGELWKLEPLCEEKKQKWRREMHWLLSPPNYMIELVPSKQNDANGRSPEIMTRKARRDIHMNLPALQKLDSMLIEILDPMVNTEFWYSETSSRAEGTNKTTSESKRWWLPSPQVPKPGLSSSGRKKKLLDKGKVVYQVFKATKSINENVLLERPVPAIIKEKIPKVSFLRSLTLVIWKQESTTVDYIITSLKIGTQHTALETVNKLETAIFSWKERITEQDTSPVRTTWSFSKDSFSETGRTESLLNKAEALRPHIKSKYPNLPHSFLDATKIQYGKYRHQYFYVCHDIGHAVLEAYSRTLANLAYRVLSRMGEILKEDSLSNHSTLQHYRSRPLLWSRVRHSLTDEMNKSGGETETGLLYAYSAKVTTTPSRSSRLWCMSKVPHDASP
ncbi:hypothetical protein Bca101_059759 [Brassica carinata]